jgi:hypothetical protein
MGDVRFGIAEWRRAQGARPKAYSMEHRVKSGQISFWRSLLRLIDMKGKRNGS